ncbi:MAG TPA: GNAT family N-acetyltransferase [Acidimicrobiales bacterium]|nr:GNAT family N-acetyltransferase [Acidimicrobiales bacterium]
MKFAPVRVRLLAKADRPALRKVLAEQWGLPVVSISGVHDDPSALPGFVADDSLPTGGMPLGYLTYIVDGDQCEVLTINALLQGAGVGRALMDAARGAAVNAGCRRLWLMTTNENLRAIAFYQRWGMDLAALHRNFADTVRAAKPAVDLSPHDGIPFRHALEFELLL